MKREVTVSGDGNVVLRSQPGDAVERVKKMKLRERVTSGCLTDTERDLALLALLQKLDLL